MSYVLGGIVWNDDGTMANKELSPLEVSKQLKDFVLEYTKNGLDRRFVIGSFDIIETALKDYEKQHQTDIDLLGTAYKTNVQNEKKLKALEIIKKKRVDMDFLFEEWEEENMDFLSEEREEENWEFALENYNMNHEIELTQEEYDLLKEVFL